MTTIDQDTMPMGIEEQRLRYRLLQKVADLIADLSLRRKRKKALQKLTMLDEHLLRDIGLNPRDLHDAFEGRNSSLLFNPYRAPYESE